MREIGDIKIDNIPFYVIMQNKEEHGGYYNILKGADLSYVNMRGMDLSKFNFAGANLKGSDLRDCDIRYANFANANLDFANLDFVRIRHTMLNGASLRKASLLNAIICESYVENVNFAYANLNKAYIDECSFLGSKFNNADLSNASIHKTYLTSDSLCAAKIDDIDICTAILDDDFVVSEKHANLVRARLKSKTENAHHWSGNFDFSFSPITEERTCMRCGEDKETMKINIGDENKYTTMCLCKACRSDLAIKLIQTL